MKVKLSYTIPFEKEIEMTPEEYCQFRSGKTRENYFPKNSSSQEYHLSDEARKELNNWLYSRAKRRS